MRAPKKTVIKHPMSAEAGEHFSQECNLSPGQSVISGDCPPRIDVLRPRDRRLERPFTGFDQKVIAMYARGMTERAIRDYLSAMYGTEVSASDIIKVTDKVMMEVTAWQRRPLEPMYPVMFFDILRITVLDRATVRHKAACLAVAILPDGTRDVLGVWIAQTEGAKSWSNVLSELRYRGVGDILIAVVDGLHGVPEMREVSRAFKTVFPSTTVQTCIMQFIRDSLEYVNFEDRKTVAVELRSIYTAPTVTAAREALEKFASTPWGAQYPIIVQVWRHAWERTIVPFVRLPLEVRRVVYGTTVIESLRARLRRIIKIRGHFPDDDAANKQLWLALRNSTTHRVRSTREWKMATNQFATLYGNRFINPN